MRELIKKSLLFCSLSLFAAGCAQIGNHFGTIGLTCGANQVRAYCVMRYFNDSGSFYMTEQTHRFCPDSLSLEITGNEPQGTLVCKMNGQNFQWSGAKSSDKNPEITLCRADILAAVFYSFTAGGGLLKTADHNIEPVKFEGRWYVPIPLKNTGSVLKITAMRNLDSGIVDAVKIENASARTALLARSSQPWFVERLNKSLPKKIDIFDISSGVASKTLLLQVGYIDFK